MKIDKNLKMPAVAVAIAVLGVAVGYFLRPVANETSPEREDIVVKTEIPGANTKKPTKPTRIKPKKETQPDGPILKVEPTKPQFKLDDEDDAKLSAEFKELYQALQNAFDAQDRLAVIELVKKLQSMDEWPDGIPKAVKLAALDSLAWFGAGCLPEALGFLADRDAEVSEMAIEKFEEMLSDMDMGDRATSEVIKALSQVVHDTDALDSFFMEFNNMRNSVKAETALAIYDSGNAEAIAVLEENLELIFSDNEGDYEIKGREDIVKYAEDNPDGEDDEETYGPTQD